MNNLHAWLSQQHHGLRTFRIFQQKLETLGRDDPAQRGLCRLLSSLVGSYVEAFDEAPLPVEVADGAYHRLLKLVASLDLEGDPNRRLDDINRIATCELWRSRTPSNASARRSHARVQVASISR